MIRFLAALCALVLVASCAKAVHVSKTPVPVSGSKADGMVRLSYEETPREIVSPDWTQAADLALQRCQAWGYSRVDEFAGITSQCADYNAAYALCMRRIVSKDYQCLD